MSKPIETNEATLIHAYQQASSPRVRDRVFARLLPLHEKRIEALVSKYAKASNKSSVAREDLHQTALLAFVDAIEGFDPTRGAQLGTFAHTVISRALQRVTTASKLVAAPAEYGGSTRAISDYIDARIQETGERPSDSDIMAALELQPSRLAAYLKPKRSVATSVNTNLETVAADWEALHEWQAAEQAEDLPGVEELLESIEDEEDRELVCRLFGVSGYVKATQDEIAAELGVSQYSVSVRLKGILERVRFDWCD